MNKSPSPNDAFFHNGDTVFVAGEHGHLLGAFLFALMFGIAALCYFFFHWIVLLIVLPSVGPFLIVGFFLIGWRRKFLFDAASGRFSIKNSFLLIPAVQTQGRLSDIERVEFSYGWPKAPGSKPPFGFRLLVSALMLKPSLLFKASYSERDQPKSMGNKPMISLFVRGKRLPMPGGLRKDAETAARLARLIGCPLNLPEGMGIEDIPSAGRAPVAVAPVTPSETAEPPTPGAPELRKGRTVEPFMAFFMMVGGGGIFAALLIFLYKQTMVNRQPLLGQDPAMLIAAAVAMLVLISGMALSLQSRRERSTPAGSDYPGAFPDGFSRNDHLFKLTDGKWYIGVLILASFSAPLVYAIAAHKLKIDLYIGYALTAALTLLGLWTLVYKRSSLFDKDRGVFNIRTRSLFFPNRIGGRLGEIDYVEIAASGMASDSSRARRTYNFSLSISFKGETILLSNLGEYTNLETARRLAVLIGCNLRITGEARYWGISAGEEAPAEALRALNRRQ